MQKKHNISMVHGGWTNPIDEYLEPTEEYFLRLKGNYFASLSRRFERSFTSTNQKTTRKGWHFYGRA